MARASLLTQPAHRNCPGHGRRATRRRRPASDQSSTGNPRHLHHSTGPLPRAALDSGADPTVVSRWIADVQAEQVTAEAALRRLTDAGP